MAAIQETSKQRAMNNWKEVKETFKIPIAFMELLLTYREKRNQVAHSQVLVQKLDINVLRGRVTSTAAGIPETEKSEILTNFNF